MELKLKTVLLVEIMLLLVQMSLIQSLVKVVILYNLEFVLHVLVEQQHVHQLA